MRLIFLKAEVSAEVLPYFIAGIRFGYENGLEGADPEFQQLIAYDYCVAGKIKLK